MPRPDAVLSHADRERLVASVDDLIPHAVRRAGVARSDAADAAQHARMELWRATAGYDPATARASFRTWAGAVVRNALAGYWHRDNREARPGGMRPAGDVEAVADRDYRTGDDTADDVDELLRAVRRQALAPVLAALGPAHRRAVEAVVIDGLTVANLAAASGTRPAQVCLTLRHALGHLAAAGVVPPDLARAAGFDPDALFSSADPKDRDARAADRRAKVKALAGRGLTAEAIAAEVGASVNTVAADVVAVRRRGDGAPLAGRVPDPESKRERVRRLAAAGWAKDRIAAELGVTPNAVAKHLSDIRKAATAAGTEAPPAFLSPQLARKADRQRQARALADSGATREAIAAELGVSLSTVYNLLREPAAVAG